MQVLFGGNRGLSSFAIQDDRVGAASYSEETVTWTCTHRARPTVHGCPFFTQITAQFAEVRMSSAPVRGSIKARHGLGSLSASSHGTSTGASQVSAKHSTRKLSQPGVLREQRCLVALAHPSSRGSEQGQHGNRGGVAGPLHVYAPAKEEYSTHRSSSNSDSFSSTNDSRLSNNAVPATSLALEPEGHGQSFTVSSSEILAPVRDDMEQLTVNLKAVVGERSNLLKAAADQIFGAGGKRLRPAIVFMVSRATAKYAGLRWVHRH